MFCRILLLNGFIVACSFSAAFVGRYVDIHLSISSYQAASVATTGAILLIVGIGLRSWTALTYYRHHLNVLDLRSQHTLVQAGPFAFSRNPLYISIWCIMLGATLFFGTVTGLIFSFLSVVWWSSWTCFVEEKSLKNKFGDEYVAYTQRVPRWFGI